MLSAWIRFLAKQFCAWQLSVKMSEIIQCLVMFVSFSCLALVGQAMNYHQAANHLLLNYLRLNYHYIITYYH